MQTVWVFGSTAVSVEEIDFDDPAATGERTRERGVRLEVRPVDESDGGSIYASSRLDLLPALRRIDLLESAPHAADRMHWHPDMSEGEPDERTFDVDLSADPVTWTRRALADVPGVTDGLDEIVACVESGLARMREPWPEVTHDHRGLVV